MSKKRKIEDAQFSNEHLLSNQSLRKQQRTFTNINASHQLNSFALNLPNLNYSFEPDTSSITQTNPTQINNERQILNVLSAQSNTDNNHNTNNRNNSHHQLQHQLFPTRTQQQINNTSSRTIRSEHQKIQQQPSLLNLHLPVFDLSSSFDTTLHQNQNETSNDSISNHHSLTAREKDRNRKRKERASYSEEKKKLIRERNAARMRQHRKKKKSRKKQLKHRNKRKLEEKNRLKKDNLDERSQRNCPKLTQSLG